MLVERDEDGVYIVSVPTIAGCRTYGRTLDEAMKNIAEAASLCLDDRPTGGSVSFVGMFEIEIAA